MKMGSSGLCFGIILSVFCVYVAADTPANCTYGDILGKWSFHFNKGENAYTGDGKFCSNGQLGKDVIRFQDQPVMNIELLYPDVAVDEFGNKGYWTMIYNQGFEVTIDGRKYFAFSKFEGKGENATSYCDQTMSGWSHNVLGKQWACYYGQKLQRLPPKRAFLSNQGKENQLYQHNKDFIDQINSIQSLWTATHYSEYNTMTLRDMSRRAGGSSNRGHISPGRGLVKQITKKVASSLPTKFDWRNIDGVSFVSPVRNQGKCGSCYSFASMGMLEARIRIQFNNSYTPVLAPQDVVECSFYSQGCDGGFAYLIGGKYAEDFGAVEESCNPYKGKDGKCSTPDNCLRHYATNYKYVGGYFGACNEEEMKLALYKNGPFAVAFEVLDDFFHYKGGIYKHTGLKDKFNPFELTNHAVLLVGWGEEDGVPYWIVKNSWGTDWGEDGYFRIIRGQDEVAIESTALESFPIF